MCRNMLAYAADMQTDREVDVHIDTICKFSLLWVFFKQFLGRNFILFIIFGTTEEMQNKAVVFFVFYSWSAIEIFRWVEILAPLWSGCCCLD